MKFKFSNVEKQHLFRAWFMISLAFAILLRNMASFGYILFTSMFTVGLGFILHELAHKWLANKFHCHAEFRANDQMLVLAIVFAFFGFIFAAPGAVLISGHLSKERNGIVSFGGPLTNLLLGLLFIGLNTIYPSLIFSLGAFVNVFLGFFNLLPLPMFDGIKVYQWNKMMYFSAMTLAGLLLVLVYF